MTEHYFTAEPESASRETDATYAFGGVTLTFTTDGGVFSRGEIDRGTDALLRALPPLSGRALDLGCGCGVVGVALKAAYPALSVTLTDVNRRALGLARRNAERAGVSVRVLESDGFAALSGETFDAVITNPPIRAGKAVIYRLFAEARDALSVGGALFAVIRKQQGAPSALRELTRLFGAATVIDRTAGYWTIRAERRPDVL